MAPGIALGAAVYVLLRLLYLIGKARVLMVSHGPRLARLSDGARLGVDFDERAGARRPEWLMFGFILVMVPLVFMINGLTKGDWFEALLFAVAVAVGLTPEMLPMIVTVNLAKGAIAMSRKKVVVKRLNAIQNFGAMDVLCTDKNRHTDAGSHHPEAPSRCPRRRIGSGT